MVGIQRNSSSIPNSLSQIPKHFQFQFHSYSESNILLNSRDCNSQSNPTVIGQVQIKHIRIRIQLPPKTIIIIIIIKRQLLIPQNSNESKKEDRITHKRSLEKMTGHQHLIRGINNTVIDPTLLDLHHTVQTGDQHQQHGSGDGLDHERASTTLHPIQGHDHQLPQRSLEEEEHDERDLGENHRKQELKHFRRERSHGWEGRRGAGGIGRLWCEP